MSLFKRLIFYLFILTLSACELPGSKPRTGTPSNEIAGITESSDASFFVTEMDGKFTNMAYEKTIALPGSRVLTVSACFKDKARKQEVVGHRFLIRGGSKEQEVTSNGSGCVIWKEDIKFNFLADEKYVEYSREIIPQGNQKGSLRVSLIINPWIDKVFSPTSGLVVNTVRSEGAQEALMGSPSQSRRTIFIEMVRVNIIQEAIDIRKHGGRYKVDVQGMMMGERIDADGARVTFDLLQTKSIVARLQLICVYHPANQPPQRAVIAQLDNVPGTILNGGRLTFSGRIELKEYCASTATSMIAMTAQVETENPLVAPFNGIFVQGQVQSTLGMGFSMPETQFTSRYMVDRSITVEDFLSEGETSYRNGTRPITTYIDSTIQQISNSDRKAKLEKLKKSVVGGPTPQFLQPFDIEFESLVLEPYQFEGINGYAKDIRRQYRGRACLRLGIDGNSIRNVGFKLKKMDGQIIDVETRNNGCFEWMDTVRFNYLAPECRSSDHHLGLKSAAYGIDRKIDVVVNPWAVGGSSAPVVLWFSDLDKEKPKAECVTAKSQIVIGYYYQDYYVDRFNYTIDPYLGLSHMRMSNMALIPRLKRPTFSDRRGFEDVNLPVGRYLLRYAIVDQHVSDYKNAAQLRNRVYTVHRSVISVRADGTIADLAPMETAPDAIASLGALNQLIVEVMPMKEQIQNISPKQLKELRDSDLESLVDEDTAIESSPHAGQLIFQSESGGFRQIPEWVGKSLVNHLEKYYLADRQEVDKQLAWVSKKENAAKVVGLTLINTNAKNQVDYLAQQMNTAFAPYSVRTDRFSKWITSPELTARDIGALCNYFINNLWKQPLATKRVAYRDDVLRSSGHLTVLRGTCINKVGHGLLSLVGVEKPAPVSAALDIEYKYFVRKPELTKQQACVKNVITHTQDCDLSIPMRMARQSIAVNESFSAAKDYGAGYSHGFEGKAKAEFGGAGAGWGLGVGSASFEVQGNSRSYSKGMSFDVDALTFRIKAEDVERCVSIRLNPALIYKKDRHMYLWKKDSVFASSLRSDLTDAERNELLSRGLLICEGKTVGRPVEFDETYYFIRSGEGKGMVVDTMSSRNFNQWFTSLRGVKDFANFRSLFQTTHGTPETYQPEVDPENEAFAPIQANFARGSRSMPGVFSTHKPIQFQ